MRLNNKGKLVVALSGTALLIILILGYLFVVKPLFGNKFQAYKTEDKIQGKIVASNADLKDEALNELIDSTMASVKGQGLNSLFVSSENSSEAYLKGLSKKAAEESIQMFIMGDASKYKVTGSASLKDKSITVDGISLDVYNDADLKDPNISADLFSRASSGENMNPFVFDVSESSELAMGYITSAMNAQKLEGLEKILKGSLAFGETDKESEYDGLYAMSDAMDDFYRSSREAVVGGTIAIPQKGIKVVSALASMLENPLNENVIKTTTVKGAEINVMGYINDPKTGKILAYLTSTGDYIMEKYTEDIPVVKPFSFSNMEYTQEGELEVLTIQEKGAPLPYIYKTDDQLIVSFVGAEFNGDVSSLKVDLFNAVKVENSLGNVTFTLDLAESNLWGYLVSLKDDQISITLKKTPVMDADKSLPLKGRTVVVDPGHGGKDPGAIHKTEKTTEADLNLALSLAVESRLKSMGASVVMTRSTDEFVSLWDRVNAFNDARGDIFVSVHHNSTAAVNSPKGVESYYFYDQSADYSKEMVDDLAGITQRDARGAYKNIQYVVRSSMGPSTLIEAGFMTDETEYQNTRNLNNIYRSADAIARSIVKQFNH